MSAVINKSYVDGKLRDAQASEQILIREARTVLGSNGSSIMNRALEASAQRIRNDNPALFSAKKRDK